MKPDFQNVGNGSRMAVPV